MPSRRVLLLVRVQRKLVGQNDPLTLLLRSETFCSLRNVFSFGDTRFLMVERHPPPCPPLRPHASHKQNAEACPTTYCATHTHTHILAQTEQLLTAYGQVDESWWRARLGGAWEEERDIGRGRWGRRDGVRDGEAAGLTRRGGGEGKGDGAAVTHEGKRSCGWQTAAGGNDQLTWHIASDHGAAAGQAEGRWDGERVEEETQGRRWRRRRWISECKRVRRFYWLQMSFNGRLIVFCISCRRFAIWPLKTGARLCNQVQSSARHPWVEHLWIISREKGSRDMFYIQTQDTWLLLFFSFLLQVKEIKSFSHLTYFSDLISLEAYFFPHHLFS